MPKATKKKDVAEEVEAAEETKEKSGEEAAPAEKTEKTESERRKVLEGQEIAEGDFVRVDVLGKTIEEDSARNVALPGQ